MYLQSSIGKRALRHADPARSVSISAVRLSEIPVSGSAKHWAQKFALCIVGAMLTRFLIVLEGVPCHKAFGVDFACTWALRAGLNSPNFVPMTAIEPIL
jgi:hypothetical protein